MIEKKYSKDGRALTVYGTIINPTAGKGRRQDAIRRQRERIVRLPLLSEDSNSIGDKYTTSSWGMCDDSPELWQDPDDHIWPQEFVRRGRIASRVNSPCPMDTRHDNNIKSGKDLGDGSGCFYSCRIFKHKLKSRDKAIELYDRMINHLESVQGYLTKDDDNENWDKNYE